MCQTSRPACTAQCTSQARVCRAFEDERHEHPLPLYLPRERQLSYLTRLDAPANSPGHHGRRQASWPGPHRVNLPPNYRNFHRHRHCCVYKNTASLRCLGRPALVFRPCCQHLWVLPTLYRTHQLSCPAGIMKTRELVLLITSLAVSTLARPLEQSRRGQVARGCVKSVDGQLRFMQHPHCEGNEACLRNGRRGRS